MELIKEIHETNVGLPREVGDIRYEVRKRAEAVVLNQANQVALLYASQCQYHHLPGGRINADEDITDALKREIREETGANAEILTEIGVSLNLDEMGNVACSKYLTAVLPG